MKIGLRDESDIGWLMIRILHRLQVDGLVKVKGETPADVQSNLAKAATTIRDMLVSG